ncbi:MAG: PHP domain-containing protein [Candidatus Cloacimonetes bacterium]|nr:PHP domain-containing protein [Candidatus Cloacimonadota bacterium]MBL7085948.1 PHP domain-containing protein [Candidatus Cloacimonadota bacterium]
MKKKIIFGKEIYKYTGCIHVHTKYSFDADGEIDDIIKSAKQSKLDFITINDHLSLDAKREINKKNYNGIYVLVGYEMNDSQRRNHYLVFNTNKVLPTSLSAKEYVKNVSEEKGYGFIAHPIEKRCSKRLRKYQWLAWDATEFDGLEIWNYLSEWTGSLSIPFNIIFKILFPNLSIKMPYKETLKKWDTYNLNGFRKSAIGSTDSHGYTYSFKPFSITPMPHKKLFKTIRTNIWLKEKLMDDNYEQQILNALKKGNSFIVNYNRGNPDNFSCYIYSKKTKNFAIPGEEIPLSEEQLILWVNLPQKNLIKIIYNGDIIHYEISASISIPISKSGFYRVEVYKGKYGWIYSNPIYVV